MKRLKSIYLFALCIVFTVSIAAAQLLYCAHGTVMSVSHFAKLMDDDKRLSYVKELAFSNLEKAEVSKAPLNQYILNVLQKTDQDWLQRQLYIGSVGFHEYLFSNSSNLPTLDFSAVKLVIREALLTDVMSQAKTQEEIGKVKTILSVLNNKYLSAIINFGVNNQVVNMLLELAPVRNTGFDGSTVKEILQVYLSLSSKNISLDQASYDIVEQLASKALELDKLRDYFDLDIFLSSAFGELDPVKAAKLLISRTDKALTFSVSVVFWCLLLLILLCCGLNIKMLKRLSACAFFASLLCLLLSLILLNQAAAQNFLSRLVSTRGAFNGFLSQMLLFIIKDFSLYLALQSTVLSLASAGVFLLFKALSKKASKAKVSSRRFPTLRAAAIIFILMLAVSWWNAAAINSEVKAFRSNMRKLKGNNINQSIVKGLTEAGGMNFLKHLQ